MTTGNLRETLSEQPPLQEGRTKLRSRRNQLLRQARKERRLSQAELAERIGVTNETISRWENGGNEPQPPFTPSTSTLAPACTSSRRIWRY